MDIKLDTKKNEPFWATWTYKGQEAQVHLQPLTRRRTRGILVLTAKDKKPDMSAFLAESFVEMILGWKGIKANGEELRCTPENKRALLDWQDEDGAYPFFDFVEGIMTPTAKEAGAEAEGVAGKDVSKNS